MRSHSSADLKKDLGHGNFKNVPFFYLWLKKKKSNILKWPEDLLKNLMISQEDLFEICERSQQDLL